MGWLCCFKPIDATVALCSVSTHMHTYTHTHVHAHTHVNKNHPLWKECISNAATIWRQIIGHSLSHARTHAHTHTHTHTLGQIDAEKEKFAAHVTCMHAQIAFTTGLDTIILPLFERPFSGVCSFCGWQTHGQHRNRVGSFCLLLFSHTDYSFTSQQTVCLSMEYLYARSALQGGGGDSVSFR